MKPSKEQVLQMLESGELYEEHKDMLHKIANQIHRQHPWCNKGDLVFEGNFAIVKAAYKWNPEKNMAISTWVYKVLYGWMKNVAIHPRQFDTFATDHTDPVFETEARTDFSGFISELREDAKLLVRAVIEAPGELGDLLRPRAPVASQKALRKYMTKQGWSEGRIESAWLEVAECL